MSTFLKNFLIFGVAGTASRLVMLFLIPLYTRTLSVSDYGRLEFLLAIYTLVTLAAGLQTESALLREFYGARERRELPQLRWATLLTALGGFTLAGMFVLAAFGLGAVPLEISPYLPLLLAMGFMTQLLGIQLVLLRFSGRPAVFGIISFVDVAVSAGISLWLMLGLSWGVGGALAGLLAGKAVGVVLSWSFTFGCFPSTWPDKALIRRMLAYSLPTLPPALLNWLQTNGTRVLLAAFLAFSDVAVASLAMRVAALFGFLVYAFRLAWEPWAFGQLELKDRDPASFRGALQAYMIVTLALAALAIAASPIIVAILAPGHYAESVILSGGFILGQIWSGATNICSIGIHGSRKTRRLTDVFLAGALTNLVVLTALAETVGVTAAMISFLASTIVGTFTAARISNSQYDTNFNLRFLGGAAICSTLMAALAFAAFSVLPEENSAKVVGIMAMLAVLCLAAVALLARMAIPARERESAASMLRALWAGRRRGLNLSRQGNGE